MSALLFWIMDLWRIHPWCLKFTLSCWKSVYTSSLDDLHHYQYGSDHFMDEELKVMWSSQAIRGQLGVLHVKEKKISKYPVNYQLPQTYKEINTGLNKIESFYWTTKVDNKGFKEWLSDTTNELSVLTAIDCICVLCETECAWKIWRNLQSFKCSWQMERATCQQSRVGYSHLSKLGHCTLVALNWSYFTLLSHMKHKLVFSRQWRHCLHLDA